MCKSDGVLDSFDFVVLDFLSSSFLNSLSVPSDASGVLDSFDFVVLGFLSSSFLNSLSVPSDADTTSQHKKYRHRVDIPQRIIIC